MAYEVVIQQIGNFAQESPKEAMKENVASLQSKVANQDESQVGTAYR